MIYLDYSATTKPDEKVIEVYNKVAREYYANSNSLHISFISSLSFIISFAFCVNIFVLICNFGFAGLIILFFFLYYINISSYLFGKGKNSYIDKIIYLYSIIYTYTSYITFTIFFICVTSYKMNHMNHLCLSNASLLVRHGISPSVSFSQYIHPSMFYHLLKV